MDLSRTRLPRRGVLALAAAAALARFLPARAQSTAGCDIGFVNGLLSIGGADCGILSPPGLQGADISLPGHMVDATGAADATSTSTTTETPQQVRQERLQRRRDHRRNQRGNTRDRREDKQQRQGDRRRAEADALTSCDDFRDQKEAIEWMTQFPDDRERLDPNHNGLACETLKAVTCSQFSSRNEVASWHERNGLGERDPYRLRDDLGVWCPNLKATVNG